MAEYIDREALCRQLSLLAERYNALGNVRVAQDYNWAVTVLDGAPAEDVAPVVHGRWDDIPNTYMSVASKDGTYHGNATSCSVCHEVNPNAYKTNYCPNCGAKMDGGDPDGR